MIQLLVTMLNFAIMVTHYRFFKCKILATLVNFVLGMMCINRLTVIDVPDKYFDMEVNKEYFAAYAVMAPLLLFATSMLLQIDD